MNKRAIQIEKERRKFYRQASAIFRRVLNQYNNDFFNRIESAQSIGQLKEAAQKYVSTERIEAAMKSIYSEAGRHFGNAEFKRLMSGKKARVEPIQEDYWFAWADKLIKGKLGQRITWITGTTKETFISTVDKVISDAIDTGISIQDMTKIIQSELKDVAKYRAERIARTEIMSASNLSTHAGAQATGLDLDKEWISYIDDKTRGTHIDINGTKVDMNEDFTLSNGNILEMPGDPAGEAEDVINCRCTVGYSAKEEHDYSWGREV